tara:strand:+ start:2101 stop:2883 length:783 start_codon:yes stop_codon:yes gene_type:complete
MNLSEAYDLIDLLLDKADQPYFTTTEKNKFLNLSISDFVNMHYQKMTADEDSRRALAGCIDERKFNMTNVELKAHTYQGTNGGKTYPMLSNKYPNNFQNKAGYAKYLYYKLPKQHLYVLQISAGTWNLDEILETYVGYPAGVYGSLDSNDVARYPLKPVKNVSIREFYEDDNDPFNSSGNKDEIRWAYEENMIVFNNNKQSICEVRIRAITLPTLEEAFEDIDDTFYNKLSFSEHHQKQIIQMAVKRMTQVDVGLMTPPS